MSIFSSLMVKMKAMKLWQKILVSTVMCVVGMTTLLSTLSVSTDIMITTVIIFTLIVVGGKTYQFLKFPG